MGGTRGKGGGKKKGGGGTPQSPATGGQKKANPQQQQPQQQQGSNSNQQKQKNKKKLQQEEHFDPYANIDTVLKDQEQQEQKVAAGGGGGKKRGGGGKNRNDNKGGVNSLGGEIKRNTTGAAAAANKDQTTQKQQHANNNKKKEQPHRRTDDTHLQRQPHQQDREHAKCHVRPQAHKKSSKKGPLDADEDLGDQEDWNTTESSDYNNKDGREERRRHDAADDDESLSRGSSYDSSDDEGTQTDDDEDRSERTDEDFSDAANERKKEYRDGGYHPVYCNELYNDRYRVVHKLGWGYFSTVWLVYDYTTSKFLAMKVQKSAEHYRQAAMDEIRLLSQIMEADPEGKRCCAVMRDSFEHQGPHGRHVCMIFDVLGENLLNLMERYDYKGIPIPIVKAISRQVLVGLYHIHSIDIIHTDLKPENVLLSGPKHKVVRMMAEYKPPHMSVHKPLLERDVSMMTKSQKKRYYAKLAKMKKEEGHEAVSAVLSINRDEAGKTVTIEEAKKLVRSERTQEGDEEENEAPSADKTTTATTKKEGGQDEADDDDETPADLADVADDLLASVEDTDAINNMERDPDSETDPEWEVERFHHVSLADFGNSCWVDEQFTDEVQTRQYRSPEVIVGTGYSTPIDLWSAACMFFELLTGEFLFDPKQNDEYPRDEDHLALMMELLGPFPEWMTKGSKGKFRDQYFDSRGELRHIRELKYWCLRDVLWQKYRFTRKKAEEIASFLLPMLTADPNDRATAEEMLQHFDWWFEVQSDDYAPLCYVQEGDDRLGDEDELLGEEDEEDLEEDEEDDDEEEEEEDQEEGDSEEGEEGRGKKKEKKDRRRGANKADDTLDIGEVGDDECDDNEPNGQEGEENAPNRNGNAAGASRAGGGKKARRNKKTKKQPSQDQQDQRAAREEQKLREWWESHPVLNPEALERQGLSPHDVQQVLMGLRLDDSAKQRAVEEILAQLE